MSKFISLHKQHRYYVPTSCTHIAADIDPQQTWPVPECGAPVWGASSFCEVHHKRVYRPGKPIVVKEFIQEATQEDPEAETESDQDQLKELS